MGDLDEEVKKQKEILEVLSKPPSSMNTMESMDKDLLDLEDGEGSTDVLQDKLSHELMQLISETEDPVFSSETDGFASSLGTSSSATSSLHSTKQHQVQKGQAQQQQGQAQQSHSLKQRVRQSASEEMMMDSGSLVGSGMLEAAQH